MRVSEVKMGWKLCGFPKTIAKEVTVEKGTENVRVSAVKTGRKLCGFPKTESLFSPFALDVPTSSKCIRLKVEMVEKGIRVVGIHGDGVRNGWNGTRDKIRG